MYYHGYMEDLAAAIARARGESGDRPDHAPGTPDRRSSGDAAAAWAPPTRAAVAAAVAAGLLALVAPTTAAESAPRATAGLAEVESIGTVPCGIADLISRTPPTVDQPCLTEWWTWKHYLATLPRLP